MPENARRRPIIGYLTMAWGALWSVSLGALFLAPRVLALHHLRPSRPLQWAMTDVVLAIVFALIGASVSFFAAAPLVIWRTVRRRPWRHPDWLAAFASLPLLAAGYGAVGFGLTWLLFGPGAALETYRRLVLPVAGVVVVGLLPVFLTYRRLVCGPGQSKAVRFAAALIVVAGASFLCLPLRVAAARPAASARMAPGTSSEAGLSPAPLLIVGLDSGNWATLDPLIARHRLPTLERLVATGIHGPVRAEWQPYWSRPAWAAILTGYGREETGIHEDLSAHLPGLPWFEVPLELDATMAPLFAVEYAAGRTGMLRVAPPSRTMLRRPPFWELLEHHGVRTAVVRFDFTYPATGEATVVVSNRVGHDEWDLMKVVAKEASRPVVAPAEEAEVLRAPFEKAQPENPREWAALRPPGPHTMPHDAVIDPERVLRIAYDIDRESFDAAESILRNHGDLSAVALYLPGFDGVCHAFWPYRFPGEYPGAPPDAADVRRLGPVIDRYLEFIDARLGHILATFTRQPNVIIVSDHGHTAIDTHPLWRGWHGPEAIFIGSGPSFPQHAATVRASYFDVAPTILALEHLSADAAMPGHPLVQSAGGERPRRSETRAAAATQRHAPGPAGGP